MRSGWLHMAARAMLGIVMVWAGVSKLGDLQGFETVVRKYDVLPMSLAASWAAVVPWLEVVAGGALLAGRWVRGAAVVLLALLGSFAVALGVNVARGAEMSCGCFGLEGFGHSLPVALAVDLGLGVLAAWLVRGRRVEREDGQV